MAVTSNISRTDREHAPEKENIIGRNARHLLLSRRNWGLRHKKMFRYTIGEMERESMITNQPEFKAFIKKAFQACEVICIFEKTITSKEKTHIGALL